MARPPDVDSLDGVLRALGFTLTEPLWREHWADSGAALAASAGEFLKRDSVANTCDWLGIRHDLREAMLDSQAAIDQNPPLRRLAWHCHHGLFSVSRDHENTCRVWACLPSALPAPQRAPLFHALVLLSGVPRLRK